jgi:hypothetical protein
MSPIVKTRRRKVSEDEKFASIMMENNPSSLLTLQEAKTFYSKMRERKK